MTAPVPAQTFVARLRAVFEPLYDEWESCYFAPEGRVDSGLLTMRRVRLRSALLVRIEEAGEPWSLSQILRRTYLAFRRELTGLLPLETPFRKFCRSGPPIHWGGSGMYFDVVTKKYERPFTRSKFWRDPFKADT